MILMAYCTEVSLSWTRNTSENAPLVCVRVCACVCVCVCVCVVIEEIGREKGEKRKVTNHNRDQRLGNVCR